MQASAAIDRASAATSVRLPLLGALEEESGPGDRRTWVDLGPVQAGLVRRLTGTRSRLVVLDLPEARTSGRTDWSRLDRLVSTAQRAEPADRILCWDLLNYLEPGALVRLAAQLREWLSGRGRIHALIHYAHPDMPADPACMVLDADLRLDVRARDAERVPAPRYSPKALEKAMPTLIVERTMLLNNGMQEFIFAPR